MILNADNNTPGIFGNTNDQNMTDEEIMIQGFLSDMSQTYGMQNTG